MTSSHEVNSNKIHAAIITGLLWLAVTVLGALCVIFGHELLVDAIVLLTGVPQIENTIQARGTVQTIFNCTFILSWMAWLTLVIGSAEYHSRRVGQPRSRRVLLVTIAIELLILMPALLIRLL